MPFFNANALKGHPMIRRFPQDQWEWLIFLDAWDDQTLSVSAIEAGTITADEIASGAITASKISTSSTVGGTINHDAGFSDESAWYAANDEQTVTVATNGEWSFLSGPQSGAPYAGGVAQLSQDANERLLSERIPIDDSKTYRVSCWARQTAGSRTNYLLVDFHDDTGANIVANGGGGGATGWTSTGTYHYWHIANAVFPGSWTYYEFTFGANGTGSYPTTTPVSCAIGALGLWGGSGASTIEIADLRLEEVIPGVLIEDGAITADKITAGTITGSEINATFNLSTKTLTADTGTIGGWTLSANDLSSGNFKINATNEEIEIGSATAPLTGTGIWIGKDGSDYEFRAGDPSNDYIHWDGNTLAVTGALDFTNASTNWTPTSFTGFSANPSSPLFKYIDFGAYVVLWKDIRTVGTSNANTFTFGTLPAAIRPSNNRRVVCVAEDNTNFVNCSAYIQTTGTIDMYVLDSTPVYTNTGWTASGAKGFPVGMFLTYAK